MSRILVEQESEHAAQNPNVKKRAQEKNKVMPSSEIAKRASRKQIGRTSCVSSELLFELAQRRPKHPCQRRTCKWRNSFACEIPTQTPMRMKIRKYRSVDGCSFKPDKKDIVSSWRKLRNCCKLQIPCSIFYFGEVVQWLQSCFRSFKKSIS